jgi:hypothetical protein
MFRVDAMPPPAFQGIAQTNRRVGDYPKASPRGRSPDFRPPLRLRGFTWNTAPERLAPPWIGRMTTFAKAPFDV